MSGASFQLQAPAGTGGLHGRRGGEGDARHDTLLTPRWAWEWLFERWTPMRGSLIVDPACCGWGGWTAGGRLAALHGRRQLLADLHPQAPTCALSGAPIHQADFFSLALPPGPLTLVTNGPFRDYPRWLAHARATFDEIVLLVRVGFLFGGAGARVRELHSYLGPARRMAFELLPEEAARRLAWNAAHARDIEAGRCKALEVVADASAATGWRCSVSPTDHGFALWRRGYTGPALLFVEDASAREDVQLPLLPTAVRVSTDRNPWRTP